MDGYDAYDTQLRKDSSEYEKVIKQLTARIKNLENALSEAYRLREGLCKNSDDSDVPVDPVEWDPVLKSWKSLLEWDLVLKNWKVKNNVDI